MIPCVGQRGFELLLSAPDRVRHHHIGAMQQDSWSERWAGAVAEVADHGAAQGLEVYPQLVAPARYELERHQGSSVCAVQDTVSAYRQF